MATHLNALPNAKAFSMLFLRESEGRYRFGSKKILIKVENGMLSSKIINFYMFLVRMGGGFNSLENFVDLFGLAEMDRITLGKAEEVKKKG